MEKKFRFLTSWDDGCKDDLLMSALLYKYKMPGIFFVPNNGELDPKQIRLIAEQFEIGGHTVSHPPDMKRLSDEQLEFEIETNKQYLEQTIDKEIEWFCYPKGKYNERVQAAVKKAGYKYARTTVTGFTGHHTASYAISTSVHVYPETHKYNKPDWKVEATRLLEKAYQEGGTFHLWSHSWEITKFQLWYELEDFFKFVSKKYGQANKI